MSKIVFRNLHAGNLVELLCKIAVIRDGKLFFQSGGNHLFMLRVVFPEIWAAGVFLGAGIRYVEHIFELGRVPGVVDEGDPLSTPANIAAHSLVP